MDRLKSLKSRFKFTNKKQQSEPSTSSYEDITLKLNQITLSRLKLLFSPNIEFEELSSELAISKLKETRSYFNALGITSSYNVDAKIVHQNSYEPFNTFGKKINANAKEYTIAYTKNEAAYYAKKKSNSEEVSDKVKERADDVEFGKKPASMAEISQMTYKIKEEYGINVKIVDNPNY